MLDLGPYAAYIWPAYALTVLVMGGLVVLSVGRLKRRQKQLAAYRRAAGPRRGDDGESDE